MVDLPIFPGDSFTNFWQWGNPRIPPGPVTSSWRIQVYRSLPIQTRTWQIWNQVHPYNSWDILCPTPVCLTTTCMQRRSVIFACRSRALPGIGCTVGGLKKMCTYHTCNYRHVVLHIGMHFFSILGINSMNRASLWGESTCDRWLPVTNAESVSMSICLHEHIGYLQNLIYVPRLGFLVRMVQPFL